MSEKISILVVDDEVPVCTSIASALTSDAISVETVLSGEEALDKDLSLYNIVITDLMMPGISGMDLLKELKKRSIKAEVIMITGYPSIKSAVESIKLGAFDYLPKPFTPRELRSIVQRIREKHKASMVTESIEVKPPAGLRCIPGNVWIKIEDDRTVKVGIHHLLVSSIDNIVAIDFPKLNDNRFQGESLIIINDSNKYMHRVWTPVAGKIIVINEKIQKDYALLRSDPYGEGWILQIMPSHLDDDLKNLVPLG